jgi:hypothetical protein
MYDDDDLAPRKLAALVDKHDRDAVVVAKAGGAHDLAGRLIEHLADALDHKRRLHGFEKKESDMDSFEKMVADRGIVAVAKAMTDENRSYGLTETDFVALATEDAVRKFPGEAADRAFTRMFTDGGADGLTLRRAHALVRAEQLYGPTVKSADRGSNSAYGELLTKAEELRKVRPELSEAQCFAKVFSDPANIELAKRERRESAAR